VVEEKDDGCHLHVGHCVLTEGVSQVLKTLLHPPLFLPVMLSDIKSAVFEVQSDGFSDAAKNTLEALV
jgi:hypothetical protein